MPADTIKRAIERGGPGDAANLQEITFEGYGPHGVAILIREPVGLVQEDDRALPLTDQRGERLVLGADQVVVEDEDQVNRDLWL